MTKVIALVDPHFKGHHLTYMKFFVTCLLNKGYKVCVFMPQKEEISEYVKNNLPQHASSFFAENIDNKEFNSFLPSVINRYLNTLYRWYYLKKKLAVLEKNHHIKVDLVFLAWPLAHLPANACRSPSRVNRSPPRGVTA